MACVVHFVSRLIRVRPIDDPIHTRPPSIRGLRCFGVVAGLLCLMVLAWHSSAARAAETGDVPSCTISFFNLGPDKADTGDTTRNFVQRLDARPECDATLIDRNANNDAWHTPPARFDAERWVSLNLVMFKRRQNWLAFQFDAKDGGVTVAAWRPSLVAADAAYSYINSIPPGPDSTFELAQIELASELANKWQQPRATPGPLVQVTIETVAAEAGDLFSFEETAAAPTLSVSVEQLDALRALALAAAWDAGLKPTLRKAADTLTLRIARTVDGYQASAVITLDGKTTTTPTRTLRDDTLYPGLRAIINQGWQWGPAVLDFVQFDAWPVRPIWYHDNQVLVQSQGHREGHTARLYKADSQLMVWDVPPPERRSPDYAVAMLPGKVVGKDLPLVVSYQPTVSRWTFADGKALTYDWPSGNHPWGFAFVADMTVLSAHEQKLVTLTQGSREGWSSDFKAAVDAGPLVLDGVAIAGARNGVLRAVSLADGATKWETRLRGRLFGPIVQVGDKVFVATQRGTLYAVRASDGELLWQRDLGDALLMPVVASADGAALVVVYGGTSLVRLNITDGTPIGEAVTHDVHAVHALAIPARGGQVALVDAAGGVSFYRTADLAATGRVALGVRAAGPPLFIADAPHQWSGANELSERGPMLMVPASDGVCFLVDIPK